MADPLSAVPASISAALKQLQMDLQAAAGQNLTGLILFGGLARGRYRPGKSDVNVVVVLREASPTVLVAIAPALKKAWRAAAVEPLVLTSDEAVRAAEVFPTKFLDIKSHHVVLFGENPFVGIEVSREHVRLRIEQELRNMLLRFRRRFLATIDDPTMLARALTDVVRPLALELAALLQLVGKPVPADDRSGPIFEAAAVEFGWNRELLAAMAALRHDSKTPDNIGQLSREALELLPRIVDLVDRMKGAAQ